VLVSYAIYSFFFFWLNRLYFKEWIYHNTISLYLIMCRPVLGNIRVTQVCTRVPRLVYLYLYLLLGSHHLPSLSTHTIHFESAYRLHIPLFDPPITRTIGRVESMEMEIGFIRPHPHRLFALESGRRSSSRPAFTPTYTTIVYLFTHVARGQYTRI